MPHRLHVERLEARELPAAPFQSLPVLPFQDFAALDHARAIAALGHQIGRRSDVVLKIGDSNSSPFPTSDYLAPLGSAGYDPTTSGLSATHPELLDTWSVYRGAPNSLAREGPGAWPGKRAPQVIATLTNDIRALNPGIALVMIGTNDAMVSGDPALFRGHLGLIVETFLHARVVPVLSTVPDSHYLGGVYQSILMTFNQVIADVAERYAVPLWNAWASLHRLPNHGLRTDGVHLNASPNGAGRFWPADLLFAQNARNQQALQILDWFRERVCRVLPAAAPEREWVAMESGRRLYAVGRDAGNSPYVDVYDADSGALVNQFLAFNPVYTLGVRVVTADTNGDGFSDIICSTARGGVIRVISGADGSTLARLVPFGNPAAPGLSVTTGDLDGDGDREIVVARGGRAPVIHVFAGGSFAPVGTFHPFDGPTRGVLAAVANVEGFGPVIAVIGGLRNPTASYFTAAGVRLGQFDLDTDRARGFVAADLDDDGFDELIVGRIGAVQEVRILDGGSHTLLAVWDLGPVVNGLFGPRLGVLHSLNGRDLLLVGNSPGSPVAVRGYDDLSGESIPLPLERANRAFGIFVG